VASPNIHQGFGGSTGVTLTTSSPIYTSGAVYFVSSTATGASDSAPGTERIKPLLTLSQALTNATNGDTIVVLASHTETITSTLTISETGLTIVGEGSTTTRPQFTRNIAANGVLLDVTGAGTTLQNLYFPATATTASTGAKVKLSAANQSIRDCYFVASTLDDGPQIQTVTGASQITIADTTIISTATAPSDQPESAITITNAITDLFLDSVTLSGGTSGWANPYAFVGTGAITRFKALQLSLLLDSDVTLATTTSGTVNLGTTSGSARVVWAA
jgi:hypothetical protein